MSVLGLGLNSFSAKYFVYFLPSAELVSTVDNKLST